MYFIVTVKYDKNQENGVVKSVKEQYMFDVLNYTECEARVIEELTPYISGEFAIDAIKKIRVAELFNVDSEAERWYKFKVAFMTIDEKCGVEKRSISTILVRADDFKEACERFAYYMRSTMADYEIVSVSETPIIDFFPAKLA